jgi:hypothetical protein
MSVFNFIKEPTLKDVDVSSHTSALGGSSTISLDELLSKRWKGTVFMRFALNHGTSLDWCTLSSNPNISFEMLQCGVQKLVKLDWVRVSMNPAVTMDMITSLDVAWYWYG